MNDLYLVEKEKNLKFLIIATKIMIQILIILSQSYKL